MKGQVRWWSKQWLFFFFPFWEPREQSYFVCFRIKTAEGPRICVNLLNKCSAFCFPFLLRRKRSMLFLCKETNNLFQIVQITCNMQLKSWLLLLSSFPRPQYPPGNKQGSELDLQLRGICGKLSLGKEPACVQIRSPRERAWQATLGTRLHR